MRKLRYLTSLLALVTCLLPQAWSASLRQNQTWPSRIYPGDLEFPTHLDLRYFGKQLDGDLITALNPTYLNASLTHNLRVNKLPGLIVKPKTLKDVQTTVFFARKHNLHLTVRSSGHDFIGRCTHDGSLSLNLQGMNEVKVNLDSSRNQAGEVTIQTGASWLEVYTQIDKVRGPDETGQATIGRLIVGGSAHTVAMGGFTQGGGHSPIGRKFGLAVDNLLEVTIVTPDGKVHIVNESVTVTYDLEGYSEVSNDTSLFWAIRGGGGGTWGVVVDFTFKIHYAPERFRRVLAVVPTLDDSGQPFNKDVTEFALQQVNQLSSDWGGYIITSPGPVLGTSGHGFLLLFLNHQGSNSSASNQEIDGLLQHPAISYKEQLFHPTFLDYEVRVTAHDDEFYSSYIFNSLIQPSSIENATTRADFVDLIYEMLQANLVCTGAMVGGKMATSSNDNTPVNPGLRSGILSWTCGAGLDSDTDYTIVENTLILAHKLYKFGQGSYINEPAEDMPDWKNRFWGHDRTYERLLSIKKRVDPTNYMWCHNCVGSDLGHNYTSGDSAGLPGIPTRYKLREQCPI